MSPNDLDTSGQQEPTMCYEKLALEVNARASGFDLVKPASVKGESGVDQRYSVVVSDGTQTYAIDILPRVGEAEVLRSYVKQLDTGARSFVVSLSGKPDSEVRAMADYYGVGVLTPADVDGFFSEKLKSLPPCRMKVPTYVVA